MKVICEPIKQSQLNRFAAFLTEEIFARATDKNAVTYGACADVNGAMEAVGVIQFMKPDTEKKGSIDNLRLNWLYVDEGFRRCKVGKTLLEFAIKTASDYNAFGITFSLYEYMLYDSKLSDVISFFESLGFEKKQSSDSVFYLNGRQVFDDEDFYIDEDSISRGIISFSKLTPDMLSQASDEFSKINSDFYVRIMLRADRELSFLYEKGTAVRGALITEKCGDTYYVRELFADSEVAARDLGRVFLLGLKKKMLYSDSLVIRDVPKISSCMEEFIQGEHLQQEIKLTYTFR